jgi:hypothetical protein
MNGGECSDHGRHSFKCKCPKATKNSTGYTDSICQTPVFFNGDGELNADGDGGFSDQALAGDQNWEFIVLAVALLVLLLVLIFLALRVMLRGKERVFINERGEAYVMDEATGATRRADFDVDVVGQSMSVEGTGGPTLNSMQSHVKKVQQITLVHGTAASRFASASALSAVFSSNSGLLNVPQHEIFSSSDLTTSSDSSEDEPTKVRMNRLNKRRTSDILEKAAFLLLPRLTEQSHDAEHEVVISTSSDHVEVTISDANATD